ncbi:MAG: hypothetical protein WCV80_01975 [Candidatus Paceibacterota bacterium]|jgi:hypothetical protein
MAKESRTIAFVTKHFFEILLLLVVLIAGAFIFAIFTTNQERDKMRADFKPGVPCEVIRDIKVVVNRNVYSIFWIDDSKTLCTRSSNDGVNSGRAYHYTIKQDCPENSSLYVEYFNTNIGFPDSAIIHIHSLNELNFGVYTTP